MNEKPKTILVTNDDGYLSPGLKALVKAVSPLGKTVVVAPESERSGAGHSLTLFQPLRLDLREQAENFELYSCNGTPTDCVSLAVNFLLKEKPAMCISGINAGGNLGDDITYSGTVMAAMEAAAKGIPAFGISLVTENRCADYEPAALFAYEFASRLLNMGSTENVFFSINVPDIPREKLEGAMITVQGRSVYQQKISEREDPWGRKYYWVSGLRTMGKSIPDSDFFALQQNMISVTPLQLSMTNTKYVAELKTWDIFREKEIVEEIIPEGPVTIEGPVLGKKC